MTSDSSLSEDKVQTVGVLAECSPQSGPGCFLSYLLCSSSSPDQRDCCLALEHSTLSPGCLGASFASPDVSLFCSAHLDPTIEDHASAPDYSHVITASLELL